MARKKIEQTRSALDLDPEDVVHGFYVGARAIQVDDRAASLYGVRLIDPVGEHKADTVAELWGSMVLDDLMRQAEPYAETWITYQGTKGRTKIYTVEQDTGNMLPEDKRLPF